MKTKTSYFIFIIILIITLGISNNKISAQWFAPPLCTCPCAPCTNGTGFNQLENAGTLTVTPTRQVTQRLVGGSDVHKVFWTVNAVAGRTYVFDLCQMGIDGLTINRIAIYDGPCASGGLVTTSGQYSQATTGTNTDRCNSNGYLEWTCPTSGTFYVRPYYSSMCTGNFSTDITIRMGYYYLEKDGCTQSSFFDPGGSGGSGTSQGHGSGGQGNGNYFRNISGTVRTYTPPVGYASQVVFSNFNLNTTLVSGVPDYLYVYDGNSIAAPQVAGSPFTGTALPGGVAGITSTALDGSLTFRLVSNSDFLVQSGWLATVNAVATAATIPQINGGLVSCLSPSTILTITNPIVGTTYNWSGPTSGVGTSLNPATVGTYTVEAVSAEGCEASNTYTIVPGDPPPTVSVNSVPSSVITCTQPSISLNSTTNATTPVYSWAGPVTGSSPTLNAPSSGTYTLTVTDNATGCSNSDNIIITSDNAPPNISASTAPDITCSSPSITLTGNSSTSGVQYAWTIGGNPAGSTPNSSTTNVTGTGSYLLTVTNPSNGCINTTNITVNENISIPTISVGADQIINCTSATATLTGNSTTSGVNYAWTIGGNPAGNTPNASSTNVTTNGSYLLTVTDPTNGCTNTASVIVNQNIAVPNISVGADQDITCTSATATLTGSSTTSGVDYAWTIGGNPAGDAPNTSSTNVTANGSYLLTVTDPTNGCTNTASVIVNQNTTLPNISVGADQDITCTSTTATLTGNSTTSGVNYAWTIGGNPAGDTPNSSTTNVTGTGSYLLTVTNPSNGCTNTANVTVNENTSIPTISVGADQIINCTSATATLTGNSTTSGVNYAWTIGGNPAGNTPNASSTNVTTNGSYLLTVTDPTNGCTNTASVIVNQNIAVPNISVGADQDITCTSATATLTGSSTTSGVDYAWTIGGNPAGDAPNTSSTNVTANGSYLLTVTDPTNGCTNTASVIVNQNTTLPDISVGADQDITCILATATLTGNSTTSGVNYAWTIGGNPAGNTPNTSSTNVTANGSYLLTVTDPTNGCSNTASVIVNQNTDAPLADAGADVNLTCLSTTVVLDGSASSGTGISYSWSGSGITADGNTATPTVNQAGTYTLTVTGSNGCIATSTVEVIPDANLPIADAGLNMVITCTETSVNLDGSNSDSGVDIVYNWTTSDGNIIGSSSNPITSVDLDGTYTLTVTNNANGCSAIDAVMVTQDTVTPTVTLTNGNQTITCLNPTVILNASATGTGNNFTWSTLDGNIVSGANSSSATVDLDGTYTLNVTSANGCNNLTNQQVIVTIDTIPPQISAVSSGNLTCSVDTISLTGTSNIVGTYLWTGGNILQGANGLNPTVDQAGVYTFTVTDNINGCSSVTTVEVLDNTDPADDPTGDCDGDGVSNEDEISNGTDPLDPCDYIAGSITLIPGDVWLDADCDGDGVTNGDELADGTDPLDPCDYLAGSITLPQGGDWLDADCDGDGVTNGDEIADGTDPVDPCSFESGSITLTPGGLWSDEDCDEDGISNGDEIANGTDPYNPCDPNPLVFPELCDESINIPNIFSPNGDGENDIFYVTGVSIMEIKGVIMNRWGQIVFEWDAVKSGWDGRTLAGIEASEGTYYYIIEIINARNETLHFTGPLQLVR